MKATKKYQNKRVAIYGMGITGYSSVKALKKLKAQIYCWDDSEKKRREAKKLSYSVKKFWISKDLIDYIIISPGIDINKCKLRKYLKKNIKKIITDLDLFFEINKNIKTISITGTNGKSTTCKLLEKILKKAKLKVITAGNIGNPVLSLNQVQLNTIIILEISSYQLQYSKFFRSKHAAILNISPDHLDRHQNMKNYAEVKSRLFYKQKNSDYSYINFNNSFSKIIKKKFKEKKLKSKLIQINLLGYTSLKKKVKNNYFISKGNIENLLFAYKIAKNLKIRDKTIFDAINKFKGLAHRQEIFLSNKNILYVNDSKATSFDASAQSLANYNNIYWIVGGLPKSQDYFKLKNIKNKIIKAYIIGKSISSFIKQIKNKVPYTISHNLNNAVKDIFKDINLKDNYKKTILLSPAAASFDQFKNFEERGENFKTLIKKINVNF